MNLGTAEGLIPQLVKDLRPVRRVPRAWSCSVGVTALVTAVAVLIAWRS